MRFSNEHIMQAVNKMKHVKVSIGLVNPKTPENVGSVMRAAGNFGVDSIYYSGTRYPHALKSQSGSANTGRQFKQNISVTAVNDLIDDASDDMKIICVEFAENALSLPDYTHPDKAFYIFGPEDGSISQAMINRADAVIYVPTTGCMNLAATVNVILYDRLSKSSNIHHGNDLVLKSRDKNNNLKVKN